LALQAVGSDATPLKLINKRDGKEWQININIGGEIEVFLISFPLHCSHFLYHLNCKNNISISITTSFCFLVSNGQF
jgi:hypothetical protein